MRRPRHLILTPLAACFLFMESCSQASPSKAHPGPETYVATTPFEPAIAGVLRIPATLNDGMMKWKLTLNRHKNSSGPSTYELTVTYGTPKQGTTGFMDDAMGRSWQGTWAINKGSYENPEAVVYILHADDGGTVSFIRAGRNILHILDERKTLLVGNAAWSYTLNRVEPAAELKGDTFPLSGSENFKMDTSSTFVFEGRIPCNGGLLQLHGISAAGCYRVKCQLTLEQDPQGKSPSRFRLATIYVGKGDTKYMSTGTWKITRGIQTDPGAVVIELSPESFKTGQTVAFVKGDDNVLFLLDKNREIIAGNDNLSYTLNREKYN